MPIARNRESISLKPRSYDLSGLPKRYFNDGEIEALLHLIESVSPKVVIEFGVNAGRTAAAVLRNIEGIERYAGIDVEPGYRTTLAVQRREVVRQPGEMALGDHRFELIVRQNGSFDLAAAELPKADAVFIDGDHSRLGVLNDYALAKKSVRPGGIIIFHDDNGLPTVEVTQTLNELVAGSAEIVHVDGTWLAFERVDA